MYRKSSPATLYLDGIKLRFSVGDQLMGWQKLENRIVTGCTVSLVLFTMGMNLMINAALRETHGPKTESGIHLPSTRGFMDDLILTTCTEIGQLKRLLTSALEHKDIVGLTAVRRQGIGVTKESGSPEHETCHDTVRSHWIRREQKAG